MPIQAYAVIDSDWATFQLVTEGATVLPSNTAPPLPSIIFTDTGFLYGQPNEQLQPQRLTVPFLIETRLPIGTLTFVTGKGDSGIDGPQAGIISVEIGNYRGDNTDINGDGLNIKAFYNVPV